MNSGYSNAGPIEVDNIEFVLSRIEKGWIIDIIDIQSKRVACGKIQTLTKKAKSLEITFKRKKDPITKNFCGEGLGAKKIMVSYYNIKDKTENTVLLSEIFAIDIRKTTSDLLLFENTGQKIAEWRRPVKKDKPLFIKEKNKTRNTFNWRKFKKTPIYFPGIYLPEMYFYSGYTNLLELENQGINAGFSLSWWLNKRLIYWRLLIDFNFFQSIEKKPTNIVNAEQLYQSGIGVTYSFLMKKNFTIGAGILANSIFYRFFDNENKENFGHRAAVTFLFLFEWNYFENNRDNNKIAIFITYIPHF